MKIWKSEKGQSMVEFAIAFIFLLFFLMGIFEFSWLMGNKLLATHATREGARYAAVHHSDGDKFTDVEANTKKVVKNAMAINVLTDGNITVGEATIVKSKDSVVVSIAYSVNPLTGFIPETIIPRPFPITASTTMKKE